jgi:hypothetical protein
MITFYSLMALTIKITDNKFIYCQNIFIFGKFMCFLILKVCY